MSVPCRLLLLYANKYAANSALSDARSLIYLAGSRKGHAGETRVTSPRVRLLAVLRDCRSLENLLRRAGQPMTD